MHQHIECRVNASMSHATASATVPAFRKGAQLCALVECEGHDEGSNAWPDL